MENKKEFEPFQRTLDVSSFKFRWMTANCYQFILPGNKTLVVDPFLPPVDHPNKKWAMQSGNLSPEDLGGADYVFVNHSHTDHVGNLKDVCDMYKPRILCHSSVAWQLSRDLNLQQTKIFPYENESTYLFNDFTFSTYTGRHCGDPNETDFREGPDIGSEFEVVNTYGALFNTDFILTTKTNLRVGFCAGTFDETEQNRWKNAGLNVFIRQCSWHIHTGEMEDIAEDFMLTGAPVMLPLHHEVDYNTANKNGWARLFNEYLASKGYYGRLYMPERGKWHSITVGVRLEDS